MEPKGFPTATAKFISSTMLKKVDYFSSLLID
jgi:hypothetical protein